MANRFNELLCRVSYVIDGKNYPSSYSLFKEAKERGCPITRTALIRRANKGINTWKELLKPASPRSIGGSAASAKTKKARKSAEKDEVAEALRALDARKAELKSKS